MEKKKPTKPAKHKSATKETSDALLAEAAAEQKSEQLARQDADAKRHKSIQDRAQGQAQGFGHHRGKPNG